jgi:hypothetical protein
MHNLPSTFGFLAIISKIIENIIKYYKKPIQPKNKSIGIHSYAGDLGYPTVP